MRVHRRLIAALLVLALLVPTAAAQDGEEATVDHRVLVFEDSSGDTDGAATLSSDWADILNGTIHETDAELVFELAVVDLGDRPDDALWDLSFTANGTDYTARVRWDGSDYTGQILAGGGQIGADTNTSAVGGQTLRLAWSGFEDELPELAILEDTYGASDHGNAIGGQDCQGDTRVDCAPDDGFGEVFPLGHTPAEGLALNVTPASASSFPNTTLEFEISVENRARNFPGFDLNATLHVQHPDVLGSELFGEQIHLQPGESVNRTLDISIPGDATTGVTHNVTVIAEPEEGLNRTVTVPLTVEAPPPPPPPYALEVGIDPARRTAERGEVLTYNVTVTNEGASPDIVTLELTEGGEWARLSTNDLTIDSGRSRTVAMTVQVPDDASEGEVRHVVTATSRNDPSVSDSGTATTEVDLPGGFVNELDRTLHDLGLGGLVPVLVILAIIVILILYIVASAMRRGRIVDVDAGFEDEDED